MKRGSVATCTLLALTLVLVFLAADSRPAQAFCSADRACTDNQDAGGDTGSGGGGACRTTCSVYCGEDYGDGGYWSSIACDSDECAHCPCPAGGGIPYPYCV